MIGRIAARWVHRMAEAVIPSYVIHIEDLIRRVRGQIPDARVISKSNNYIAFSVTLGYDVVFGIAINIESERLILHSFLNDQGRGIEAAPPDVQKFFYSRAGTKNYPVGHDLKLFDSAVADIKRHLGQIRSEFPQFMVQVASEDLSFEYDGLTRITAGAKTFFVYVDKVYFPKESYAGRVPFGTTAWESWDIKASDRVEAAKTAWRLHGEQLLKAMQPQSQTRFPHRVSLMSGEKGSVTGAASRLMPVAVWQGWLLPGSKVAAHLMPLDVQVVQKILKEFQDWAESNDPHDRPSSSDKYTNVFRMPNPQGKSVPVLIAFMPHGGSEHGDFGFLPSGEPLVRVYFPHIWTWGSLAHAISKGIFRPLLMHELTHALDLSLRPGKEKGRDPHGGLESEGGGPRYFNNPSEVKAYTREIYEEIEEFVRRLMHGPMLKKWGLSKIIMVGLSDSKKWRWMKPYLTPQTHNRILSVLAQAFEGGTHARIAATDAVREHAIYVGVFLSSMDKQRLLKAFPPIHPQVFADHMTIRFRDDPSDIIDLGGYPLGKTVTMKVVGMAEDDKAQVVLVQPQGIRTEQGRVPHITISTAAGVTPQHSNDLVARGHTPVRGGVTVRGTVAWWDGQRPRTDW